MGGQRARNERRDEKKIERRNWEEEEKEEKKLGERTERNVVESIEFEQ